MLDITFIRDNLEAVEANIRNRHMKADARAVVALADRRSQAIQKLEGLRASRNENASKMKGKLEVEVRNALIEEGKQIKEGISGAEADLEAAEKALKAEMMRIPNMAHPQAPVGKEDKDNLEIKRVGQPTKFSFAPLDHVQLGEKLDIIDFDAGTKVSGTKFYFLKNEGVFLELALTRYVMDILVKKGFTP
ncbi:MAG TPA: serine--tRNA ligase, partial [Spirochaetia bacterium]|nr:serine--tRNA ligase [Spirochaetia bacterium]